MFKTLMQIKMHFSIRAVYLEIYLLERWFRVFLKFVPIKKFMQNLLAHIIDKIADAELFELL